MKQIIRLGVAVQVRHTLGVVLLFILGSVQAAPVTWTLNNVTFADGATLEGRFSYDASTNSYSNVFVYASDRGPFQGLYSDLPYFGGAIGSSFGPGSATGFQAWFTNDAISYYTLNLNFASAMTNAVGIIAVSNTSYENRLLWPTESLNRYIVSGTISAVPIPAAVWLFGSGLGLLGWLRRRQAA